MNLALATPAREMPKFHFALFDHFQDLSAMPPNEHDAVLALYITREELTEIRTGVIQFGAFMQQQVELNKFILAELKELRGEVREGEDTKKNLRIDELTRQLQERKDKEFSARWTTYGIVAAIAIGVLGGGCSLASAWMSYRQPSIQMNNVPPQGAR